MTLFPIEISSAFQAYIQVLVEKAIENGAIPEAQKEYLRRFCELEGVNYSILVENLNDLISLLQREPASLTTTEKRLVRVLAHHCFFSLGKIALGPDGDGVVVPIPCVPSPLIFSLNGAPFKMLRVDGGSFQMGATQEQDEDAEADEQNVHEVTLDSFYLGETPVTQALWKEVMGDNPSQVEGDKLPVDNVSWDDVVGLFLPRLNELMKMNFRLPTEAEWEYAARGGAQSRGCKYAGSDDVDEVAWHDRNSQKTPHPVKALRPNELGFYDMSGNVWEWCSDWYDEYSDFAVENPPGPSSGSKRVLRGGCWQYSSHCCRVSNRSSHDPGNHFFIGLRLALSENDLII